MFCSKCGSKNNEEAKFCANCGDNLIKSVDVSDSSVNKPTLKLNYKYISVAVVLLFFSVVGYVGAQYYADYSSSKSGINEATTLFQSGEFEASSNLLTSLGESDIWMTPWQEEAYEALKTTVSNDVSSKEIFDESQLLRESGELEKARDKFNEIPAEYSRYNEVQTALTELQSEIENKLREQAETNQAEAETAVSRADASAAAANRAEQERAAANAAASAAAREKDQAEALMAEQQIGTFVDEAVTIYNSLSNGSDEIITAIDYGYDDPDNLLYHTNRANTIMVDVEQRAVSFYEYRTPEGWEDVPTWLYNAATNYQAGIYSLLGAGSAYYDTNTSQREYDAIVQEASEYLQTGLYYENLVSEFLSEMGR